jgi:hypothetical protein
MESTKTGRDQVIDLDPEQVAVLRWHVERLPSWCLAAAKALGAALFAASRPAATSSSSPSRPTTFAA